MRAEISMSGEAKLKMFDLEKWNTQATESVREVVARAKAPCVGHCLVFMDFIDADTIIWKFKTHLAFDPNDPPSEEQRAKLERIFEGYAVMAQKLMDSDRKPS
jgi:hypothetical protein